MKKTLLMVILLTALCYSAYADTLQQGLVAHWTFDEANGTIAHDSSGHDRHLTLVKNAKFAPNAGVFGGALKLDSRGSHAVDEDGEEYINGLGAFTVSVWVKSDIVGHDRGIFHSRTPDGFDDAFMMRYDAASWRKVGSDLLILAAISTDKGSVVMEGSKFKQTSEWQHLALTWDGGAYFGKLRLYIDGKLDDPYEVVGVAGFGSVITNATKFIVGQGSKDRGNSSWGGLIDEFRIYNRELSAEDIQSLLKFNPKPLNVDVNDDGVVNILDLVLVASLFGTADPKADINGDGTVNIQDLILVAQHF